MTKRRMAHGTTALPVPAAGTDVYDAADPGEPVGRVVDAARRRDAASLLFETTLAALPPGSCAWARPTARPSRWPSCPTPSRNKRSDGHVEQGAHAGGQGHGGGAQHP